MKKWYMIKHKFKYVNYVKGSIQIPTSIKKKYKTLFILQISIAF